MKATTKVAVLAAAALLISAPAAFAFHAGGVAACEGCHSMHNSFEGTTNVTNRSFLQGTGPYLLKANDQSGACLNCHSSAGAGSYQVNTLGGSNTGVPEVPLQLTPAGDFAWLKKTVTFTLRTKQTVNKGERHGHNIVAIDYGFAADSKLTTAPGGTYPAANLACSSCHDPHGKYRRAANGSQTTTGRPIISSGSYGAAATSWGDVGVYRLLGGYGYFPKSVGGDFSFGFAAPDAVARTSYNGASSSVAVAADQKDLVIYGKGMSEFCANCHAGMHKDTAYQTGQSGQIHPAGSAAAMTNVYANYNDYVKSGVLNAGAGGYSALAPFELNLGTADNTAYLAMAKQLNSPPAASGTTVVSCLSCHRAHASGFQSMTRYSLADEFMTVADSSGVAKYDDNTADGAVNQGLTPTQQIAAYNGRPASNFGPFARNYCNKCHAKD
ncbi:MAG: hypothetical protein WCP20_15065 [Desulfuromonadales bacterium]